MKINYKTLTGIILLLLAVATMATAAPSTLTGAADSELPIEVDAEKMELRGKENLVIFSGSVVSRRGDVDLSSDELVVFLDEEGKEVQRIEAEGNVRIRKGDILISGDKGVLELVEETFVITGNPRMWRGRDVVEGELIRLNLVDEKVNVEGAKIIMFPADAEKDTGSDKGEGR